MAIDGEVRAEAAALMSAFRGGGSSAEFWPARLPVAPERQEALSWAFDAIGVEAFNAGDAVTARDAFYPMFLLRLELVKRSPSDRAALRDFASAEDLFALALIALGHLKPAEDLLTEALSYRRGLTTDEPEDAHAAYLCGVALNHMARLERAKGDVAATERWLREAETQLVDVDRRWPGISFVVTELADVRASLREAG
jgi:hypothetical protein